MRIEGLIAVVAGVLASTGSAAVATRPKHTTTSAPKPLPTTPGHPNINLGNVTFGAPFSCGDAPIANINTTDCTMAIAALLASICSDGICTLQPAVPGATLGGTRQLFGNCEAIVNGPQSGDGLVFNEEPVKTEFPLFISECIANPVIHNGAANIFSTDGNLRLLVTNGQPVGPE